MCVLLYETDSSLKNKNLYVLSNHKHPGQNLLSATKRTFCLVPSLSGHLCMTKCRLQ